LTTVLKNLETKGTSIFLINRHVGNIPTLHCEILKAFKRN